MKFIKLGLVIIIFFADCGISVSEHSVICISINLTAWLGTLTFQNHACSLTLTSDDGYLSRLVACTNVCLLSQSACIVVSKINGFCFTEVND